MNYKGLSKLIDSSKSTDDNPLLLYVDMAMTYDGDCIAVDNFDLKVDRILPEWIKEAQEYAKTQSRENRLELAYCDGDGENFTIETFPLDGEIEDSLKILDKTDVNERFYSLMKRVGDKPQHYINQIAKCGEDKRPERASTFYKLALKEGLNNTARRIKQEFPNIYASEEQIAEDRRADEEKERIKREEIERKRLEVESKKPINVLKANMEKTGKSPCFGLSDKEVDELQDRLYHEMVPNSGPAKTQAGEMLRAWNDLMYRFYNDGDWFNRDGAFGIDTIFTPRQVSNMKYLTSHGAAQISYFLDNTSSDKEFVSKVQRMLLNQIVKHKLYEVENQIDSRTYWTPGRK